MRCSSILKSVALATACAAWSLAAANGPVATIVASDNPANWLGAGNPALDGVARLNISAVGGGGGVCSGNLLSGGQYLLTAAHCITDDNTGALVVGSIDVAFKSGTVNTTAAAYFVAPGWRGFNRSAGDGSDLAIVKLSSTVASVRGYELSNTNDVGRTFMMAGYGLIGTGAVGATGGVSALHYGFNVNDTTDYDMQMTLRNGGYGDAQLGPMYPIKYGETYVYDFDSGNADQNALKRMFNLAGAASSSGLGLGASESMIAPGDSGGGDFVLVNGQYVLSAVHSYGWDLCTTLANGGLDDSLGNCVVSVANGSSFGSLGGSTAVFSSIDWIHTIVTVPEPGTWALMLAGLGVFGFTARRRHSTPA